MNYQVLARKYRPRRFEELVGQEHVQKALKNALDNDRLHHAYLFTGTRGVGKTTIARILSRCLNCEQGVGSNPCGTCGTCREIDEGRFVDLIEVDAASRTKVEDTRELLENVQYAPTRGRYKVYLIDEVHMLTTHSFNALLKTLEEPPPHVKFLLATTDPQKLPITVLSRCLQFNLKAMTAERIVGHLRDILARESIGFDDGALWELARAAQGSMRDALSLTDQAIAHGNGTLAETEVRAMLGTVDRQYVWKIAEALASGDAQAVLAAVGDVAENAPDWGDLLAGLISMLHRVCVAQVVPEAIDDSRGDRAVVMSLAGRLPVADVQLFYQTALIGRRDLPLAPEPRAGLEMTLLRMLAFRPAGASPSAAPPTGGGEGTRGSVAAATTAPTTAATPTSASPGSERQERMEAVTRTGQSPGIREERAAVAADQAPVAKKPEAPSPVRGGAEARPLAAVVPIVPTRPVAAVAPIAPVAPVATGAPAAKSSVPDNLPGGNLVVLAAEWEELVAGLGELSREAQALARNSALESRQGDVWELVIAPGSELLLKGEFTTALEQAVSASAGQAVKLRFVSRQLLGETPRMASARRARERLAQVEQLLRQDGNVCDMMEIFSARIVAGSVKPAD